MHDIESSPTTHLLKRSIIEGSAFAVSDGSYFPFTKTSACAWIISTPGKQEIEGGGVISGEIQEQNSYRSELVGQLGVAVVVDCLKLPTIEPPNKYHITTICDGI